MGIQAASWPSVASRTRAGTSRSTTTMITRAVLVLEPAGPPDPSGRAYAVARADQMAIRQPPRLGPDHTADAAPRLHAMVDPAPPGDRAPRRTFRARRPVRSVRGGLRSRSPRPPDGGANPGALFRLTGNRGWPHCGPVEHPDHADPSSSQILENCVNAANSWIPASGRSRTRTWDLFLIRKTFCPLQSPQLALNPCKPLRRRRRKRTGGDWTGQAGGPIVAPRPPFEGMVSYGPVAVIMPTIRSSPDAPEAGRCAPA